MFSVIMAQKYGKDIVRIGKDMVRMWYGMMVVILGHGGCDDNNGMGVTTQYLGRGGSVSLYPTLTPNGRINRLTKIT